MARSVCPAKSPVALRRNEPDTRWVVPHLLTANLERTRRDRMNALKWLGVAAVVVLSNTIARTQDEPDYAKLLIGKWEVAKADEGTVPEGSIIEFTRDGKV